MPARNDITVPRAARRHPSAAHRRQSTHARGGASYPERPFWAQVLVFAATGWPILAGALQWLWFDRQAVEADLDKGRDSIEHSWHQDAAATSFYTLIGGLIALETIERGRFDPSLPLAFKIAAHSDRTIEDIFQPE